MQIIRKLDMRYPAESSKQKARYGLFLCPKCTTSIEVAISNGLRAKSCKPCQNVKHGDAHTRLYKIWMGMKQRCGNKRNHNYSSYGGRGVGVSSEWDDFTAFKYWAVINGYKDNLTIDRIDNDKGYSPDNCRFASRAVQSRNTRRLKSTNVTGYRGISWHEGTNKWRAIICVDYNPVHIGLYHNKLDAAKAYDQYIIDNGLEHTTNGLIKESNKHEKAYDDARSKKEV